MALYEVPYFLAGLGEGELDFACVRDGEGSSETGFSHGSRAVSFKRLFNDKENSNICKYTMQIQFQLFNGKRSVKKEDNLFRG